MKVGSVIVLRKAHPCGGYEWKVIRTGADFKIKCLKCGREVWLPKNRLERLIVKDGLQDKNSSGGKG